MAVRKQQDVLKAPGSSRVVEVVDTLPVLDTVPPREQWTLNGGPIPLELQPHIFYQHTDQYKAVKAAQPGMKPSGVTIVSGEWDKMLEQRRDQPWASSDPIKEAVDLVREPGFRYRALSPVIMDKKGSRGWQTVTQKNGDAVKVGRLTIGKMPIEKAEERNAHYRGLAAEQMQGAEENLRLTQERTMRNLKGGGDVSLLRSGEIVQDSSDPRRSASIGVSSSRGSGQDAN